MDERIIEILKKHNFSITNTEADGEKYFTEILFSIGEIENTFLLTHNGTPESFVAAFSKYAKAFNVESYVKMCLDHRGEEGWPNLRQAIYEGDKVKGALQLTSVDMRYKCL